MKFAEFYNKNLTKALEENNFINSLKVQDEVYNNFLNSKNLVVSSKTGSGKTLAYLLPILNNIKKENKVFCVILLPTNELCFQVYEVCKKITKYIDIDIKCYSANCDSMSESLKLENKQPDICIGTIGKLYDLCIKKNKLKLFTASYFVIDEADMVLYGGYEDNFLELLSVLNNSKKMLFSATYNKNLNKIINKHLDNPIYLNGDNTKNKIEHLFIDIKHNLRQDILKELVNVINPYLCLVFVSKKNNIQDIFNEFIKYNKRCIYISAELNIRDRKKILKDINLLKYQYVICSDTLSRGIDFEGVSHIINYDLPYNYEFYIHRMGRTARLNSSGIVYTLYDKLDDNYLDNLLKFGINPSYVTIKNNEIIPARVRNERKLRKEMIKDYYNIALKQIKQYDKKPGYKKKRKQEALELANILKKKELRRKKCTKL